MDRPTGSAHVSLTMAALTIAGGVAGYVRTRSAPSLVAGGALGAAFLVGASQIGAGHPDRGHATSLAAALALAAAMGARFAKTRRAVPAGVLAVTGLVAAAYEAKQTADWW